MRKKTPDTEKILKLLNEATSPVSAARIASRARMAYDSVSKRIADLRNEGYDIHTMSIKGQAGAKATTYSL